MPSSPGTSAAVCCVHSGRGQGMRINSRFRSIRFICLPYCAHKQVNLHEAFGQRAGLARGRPLAVLSLLPSHDPRFAAVALESLTLVRRSVCLGLVAYGLSVAGRYYHCCFVFVRALPRSCCGSSEPLCGLGSSCGCR